MESKMDASDEPSETFGRLCQRADIQRCFSGQFFRSPLLP
jgi:hypothetical protein